MKIRYLLPLTLPLFAFTECGPPYVTIKVPEQCKTVEVEELPAVPAEMPALTHRMELTTDLGAELPEGREDLAFRAWLTRAEVSAVNGAPVDFIDEVALSVVGPDGAEQETARSAEIPAAATAAVLEVSERDLVPQVQPDGTLRIALDVTGKLPAVATRLQLTTCVAGEAEVAL